MLHTKGSTPLSSQKLKLRLKRQVEQDDDSKRHLPSHLSDMSFTERKPLWQCDQKQKITSKFNLFRQGRFPVSVSRS